ncbi:hypothetical protein CRG98_050398, partial [Punica granatum]
QPNPGGSSRTIWRETHSHVHLPEVVGRDIDRDAIVECLMGPNMVQNPFIVSIVGIGGLGKTTLAKLVFNDSRIEAHFEKRIWVFVSEEFNLKKILQKIVSCVSPTVDPSNHLDIEQLQANLRDILRDKKFLLVLDDVWNENRRQWNELSDLLSGAAEGSSVIVTTRSLKVASTVRTCYKHKLGGLSHDYCMSLFEKHVKVTDPELLDIVSKVVEKCGGVPLVLRALGGVLHLNTDVRYWRSILDKSILSVLHNEDDILPIIKLSYDHLPPHLKRCFHFCSLFPKDFQFNNIVISRYWKSVGLINMINDNQNSEEVAEEYMKELLARSFFHDFKDYGAVFKFKMHDLVHDLALSVAQNECSTVTFNNPSIPCRVQHILIADNTFNRDEVSPPSLLSKPNNCWTVMLRNFESGISKALLTVCISSSKYLRLLDLDRSNFEVIPDSIGTLKHLRHLNLEHNRRIRRLPSSICNLQSLQALCLNGCESLEELPRDMWKLISLEQLSLTTKQRSLKSTGIGYLKSLKFLWICQCNNLESLFEGMNVEGLTALQGLSIRQCASLTSIPVDQLKYLGSLEVLAAIDCGKLDLSADEQIFPLMLRTLDVRGLPLMSTVPVWFLGFASTLECLSICNCEQLEELPEWLKQFRHLKRLQIYRCNKVVSLPDGVQNLPALKRMEIFCCRPLGERCRLNGPEWDKIAHVSEIVIDFERIN